MGYTPILTSQSNELQLLNEVDSLPIIGAHMIHLQDGNGFISNEEGKLLKPNKGIWQISHLGYKPRLYEGGEEKDTFYLRPVFTVLKEVEVYAFDFMGYLNKWLIDPNQSVSKRTLLFRKLSRTNGELSHLFQAQIIEQPGEGLFLSNVQYSSQFQVDSPLSHGGYVAPRDLLEMIHLNYPIHFLLKFMKGYTIEKMRTNDAFIEIQFSGIIRPDLQTEVMLRQGELLLCSKTKNLLSIAWKLEWPKEDVKRLSKRYRKAYTVWTRHSRMMWKFHSAKSKGRSLNSFEYGTQSIVDWGPKDQVSLTYQLGVEPASHESIKAKLKLDLGEPLLDQVKHVPLQANSYLLTQEEYEFINRKN